MVALVVALLAQERAASSQEEEEGLPPPNIVFVVTDDMRADDLRYMPQTTKLIGEAGASFKRAYATYPWCCPSRATMLSGLYAHNHGVKSNIGGFQRFKNDEPNSVAVALDAAGYRTGLFGKYLNRYRKAAHVPAGWDEWHAKIDRPPQGPEYYKFAFSEGGHKVNYNDGEYQTDVISEKVEEYIRSSSGAFFAYVAPPAPHGPYHPAARHRGAYEGLVGLPDGLKRRAETLLAVDEMMANIVHVLEEVGELDNTYIVFTSDNGYMLGEHGRHGKRIYYEESAKIPLLIRGPGVTPGIEVSELVANTDFAPTWADLAGTSLSLADGRSLVPLLDGGEAGETPWRNQLLLEAYHGPTYKAIVTERYKLVSTRKGGDKLFDLLVDPGEHQNIIGKVDPALRAELRAKLGALTRCAGAGQSASCQAAEDA